MDLATLPWVPCNHRAPRSTTDLIVIHTNEGNEGPTSAEGLASYLQHADPGYNVVVDENSAIKTAGDHEQVWGAGGVNSRAWHLCITGWSAQTASQWDDAASRAACVIAADLVRQAAALLGVPTTRQTDTRDGRRGICGHVDVSRYHPASMGHTDPGDGFPWDHFLALVNATAGPTPEQIAAFIQLLEEADVEHGQIVHTVIKPGTGVTSAPIGYNLSRGGEIENFGGAITAVSSGYWPKQDVARVLTITDWGTGKGYVTDLDGALHPVNGAPAATGVKTHPRGKVVPFDEY